MSEHQVNLISECFVKPNSQLPDSKNRHYLSPIGLKLLSIGNTQHGLLFNNNNTSSLLSAKTHLFDNLKHSLSHALVYFYPLAGRLETIKYEATRSCSIFVDCNKGPGVRLIHASAFDVTVDDVISLDTDVPPVVHSFFDLGERQVNHDGHTRALLSVQMTELADGVFIACCLNHCVGDGTSVSIFLNVLSQIFIARSPTITISRLPVFKAPDESLSKGFATLKLPFLEANEFISRFRERDIVRDRIFRFTAASMANLKANANADVNNKETRGTTLISSFKALCGLIWKSITRARNPTTNEETTFSMAVNIRPRLDPPMSPDYFPACFVVVSVTANVGELLANGLGWAAKLIHQKVETVNDKSAREALVLPPGKSPTVNSPGFVLYGSNRVMMGGSSWFGFHKVDFGIGKLVAVRKGYTNRDDGKISAFLGHYGPGSVDLEVVLLPETMNVLLSDEEFMSYVS